MDLRRHKAQQKPAPLRPVANLTSRAKRRTGRKHVSSFLEKDMAPKVSKLGRSKAYRYSSVYENRSVNTGHWERSEHLEFLRGLSVHGAGKWKLIADRIPSRTAIQVKSHAQVFLRRFDTREKLEEFRRSLAIEGKEHDALDDSSSTSASTVMSATDCMEMEAAKGLLALASEEDADKGD